MFTALPKVRPGDRVAVVSPSAAAPARFPAVHALAMRRLREEFGLEPVEYPTTRRLDSSPQDRAADLMAAFADPGIRAVLATIGAIGSAAPTSTTGPSVPTDLFQRAGGPHDHVERVIRSPRVLIQARKL